MLPALTINSPMRSLPRVLTGLISTTAIGLLLTLTGCYNDAADFKRLAAAPAESEGRVVYVDCNSHGLVVYAFDVGGQEYRGKAAGLNCGRTKLGDQITIFYDPTHPVTNTSRQPSDAYEAARGWYVPDWVLPLIVLPLMIIIGIVARVVFGDRLDRPERR